MIQDLLILMIIELKEQIKLENTIIKIFRKSRNYYRARKIKKDYNVKESLLLDTK